MRHRTDENETPEVVAAREQRNLDDLRAAAQAWIADDPEESTRTELQGLLDATESGDPAAREDAWAGLRDRFAGLLEFGTAGLRGAIGAGPNRMNRAVVIRAAAGLTAYLQESTPSPVVVIGCDARHGSADFARDTAAVVTAAGGRAILLPAQLPTPVLAFAIRHLGADAGVMVTASHNPAPDNGYKVYLGDGSQIVPPVDGQIRAHILAVASVASVSRADSGWELADDSVVQAYVAAVAGLISPDAPRDLRVAHTSLHGVGHTTVAAVFERAGFPPLETVAEQRDPDPDFPTVSFPNPEEPGALDLALELAARVEADLLIANDPDADRCAVAVPRRGDGGWRVLRGDELGVLLGAHVIATGVDSGDVLARSIVSSRLLGAMAQASGAKAAESLTGFKWISRVPSLRYGYEEAMGYCVAPQLVADKDGISAAVVVAEQAAWLKAQGRSLLDVLDDLAVQHGVYATDAFSVRVSRLPQIGELMARLRDAADSAPESGDPRTASRVHDLAQGSADLPPTDGLRYDYPDRSRVIVRPSGTEPKLKIYLEVIEPVTDHADLSRAREAAADRLTQLRSQWQERTALPDPAQS